MKPVWKRTVALTLATALTAGLVIPAMAASNSGTDTGVYDDVLGIREDDFTSSIAFEDGEAKFTGEEWYDKSEVIGINRERAKSQFISYQDADTALAAEKSVLDDVGPKTSDYYMLLSDSKWDFALVKNPEAAEAVDAAYLAENYEGTAFQKEYVPQAWQTYRNEDGTFKYDEPMYTNQALPWFNNFESDTYTNPTAPTQYNPVGYYRTTFTLPEGWDGRETFISFQSVESAYYLYVNGHKVGYSTDSFSAHDFNITPYLNESGENTIALKVFRWSIGSWLENQDFIRQSGIYRDVYLYSKDEAEIRDFFVTTKFDDRTSEDSDVNVTVETDVRALHNTEAGTYTVSAYIKDDEGTIVAKADDKTVELEAAGTFEEVLKDAGTTVTSTMKVLNPAKWFPDTPNLYSLVLELKKGDTVMEAVVERIGFREIYKVDIDEAGHEQMQITGRQVVLRGVNRHDTDLETGHALTFEDYLTDLTLMKQYNLNAIRTSHYPNDKALYDLADELGLYVCAEANVESHAAASNGDKVPTGRNDSGMAEWVAPVLDRVATNLEMYKNNPSVIMWSLGNEATYSWAPLNENYGFYVASMYLLKRDPDRLRKYERESDGYQHNYVKAADADPWDADVRKANIVDIHSTQYALPSNVANYNGKMPYVHSEYNHAMGQAYGNALEHWDVIRQKDNAQGGFIWDFIDQSIRTVRDNGDGTYDEFWGYGGDWIDTKANDNAFCGNGLVFADRTPSPKLTEAKKVHQQVNFYIEDANLAVTSGGQIPVKVVNEYENTSLSAFNITWKLTEDGVKTLDSGTLKLDTPNMDGQSIMTGDQVETVIIDLKNFQAVEGRDYLLDFSVTLKEGTDWAEAGHEVAYEQFQLDVTNAGAAAQTQAPDKDFESVQQVGSELILTGTTDNDQKFEIVLDTKNGVIKSYSLDGNVVMTQGPEQSLYRAETYNDTTVQKDSNLKNAGATENLSDLNVAITKADNQVLMAMSGSMKVDADALMAYQIYGNGEIVVLSQFIPSSNFAPNGLPKIGGRMLISGDYDNLTFYGRGPDENYVDRQSGSTVGVYTSTVYDPNDPMGENSTWDGKKMLKPQDNGNRTDIRWTALTNDQGVGLMVTSDDQLLESSVAHYTAEEMNSGSYNSSTYRHPNQIPQGEDIVWNLDLHQNGVSDTAFMGHKPLNGYFFPTNQTYSYSYRISPVSTKDATKLMEKGNESFEVPTSTYPITSISINGKEVAGFDVGSETGSSYTLAANESITSVTVEGTENYTYTFNEDGTLTVTAANNYGQEFNYVVKLVREGTELNRDVLSKAKVDNNYSGQDASKIIDGNESTLWHSDWSDTSTEKLSRLWFMVELKNATDINGIRYLPRQDKNNGNPTYNGSYGEYDVYVSSKGIDQVSTDPNSADWTKVASGSWAKTVDWKTAGFGEVVNAKSVLVVPRSTYGDTKQNAWGSCAEFRVTGATAIDTQNVTVELDSSYTYKGEAVRPDPKVKLNDQTLIRGVDYTVEYTDNQKPGTGTLTVNFCGAFTGETMTKQFEITEGDKRTLTLNLGSGTSEEQVYVGQTITLEAGEAPENKMFDHWSSTSQNVTFEDAYSENTTFVMPDENVTVTANYMDGYTVTVVGGSLDEEGTITSQMYKVGSSVTFFADIPEGKVFDHWTTDGEDAHITDAFRNPALMDKTPARDVVVTAHFVTDPNYFEVLDNLPDHRYLGQTFTPPATLRVIQGDEQSDAAVTWNQAQVDAINAATQVSTLPLTGTVAGHDVSTTVAVVPGNVVYFVDAGASAFTNAVENILKYNSATLLNSAPDQAYTEESGWGYTNPAVEVETNGTNDVYSTVRNMTASSVTDGGHGKTLTYQFDNLEAGTYQVYVGYKDPWSGAGYERNATIGVYQGEQELASKDCNQNVSTGEYVTLEAELSQAGTLDVKLTPKATNKDSDDVLVSFIAITKDGEIVQPQEYSITVNKEGQGTASVYPETAAAGDTVTLFQEAAEGWHFKEWKVDDETVEITGNSFTMPAKNVTVTAVFEEDAHTHTYGKPTFTFSEDGKTATAVFTCACDNQLEMDAAVTAKVKEEATCTQMGTTTYTATVVLGGKTYTDAVDITDIPVTEHHYVDGVCTECGAQDPNYVPPTENPDPDPSTPVDPEPSTPVDPEPSDPVTGGDVILDNNTDNRITVGNADKVFEQGTVITVESVTQGKIYDTVKEALKNLVADMKNTAILDITATLNGKPVQPNGKVQMTFAIPENLSVDNLKLFYVSDDGKTTEEIAITVNKDARTVTANLEHFSTYVLANVVADQGGKVPPTGDANQMLLYVAAMAVSMSLLCGAVVVSRKRKG